MNKTLIAAAVAVIAIGSISAYVIFGNSVTPLLTVSDQSIATGSVSIENATAAAPSWLVIQTETNGVPGPVIGYTRINKGENSNVSVKIDAAQATPKLFAMIHEDTGEKGKFDFPGNDMPLLYKGEMVSKLFTANPVVPAAAEAAAPAAKEFKIDAYKFYYSPDVITVKKGDKVKITVNNADVPHGIRIPDLGLNGNEAIEFTAEKAGEFIWYCNVYCGEGHKKMQGRLIVE